MPRAGSLSPGSPGGGDDEARELRLREMVADVRSASAMCDGPVGVEGFIAAMEAVIAHDRTGPRAYLAAGQGRFSGARAGTKAAHAAAAAREQALAEVELGRSSASATRTERLAAARQRKLGVSSATPIYEKLAVEGRFKDMKLRERAAALEPERDVAHRAQLRARAEQAAAHLVDTLQVLRLDHDLRGAHDAASATCGRSFSIAAMRPGSPSGKWQRTCAPGSASTPRRAGRTWQARVVT